MVLFLYVWRTIRNLCFDYVLFVSDNRMFLCSVTSALFWNTGVNQQWELFHIWSIWTFKPGSCKKVSHREQIEWGGQICVWSCVDRCSHFLVLTRPIIVSHKLKSFHALHIILTNASAFRNKTCTTTLLQKWLTSSNVMLYCIEQFAHFCWKRMLYLLMSSLFTVLCASRLTFYEWQPKI